MAFPPTTKKPFPPKKPAPGFAKKKGEDEDEEDPAASKPFPPKKAKPGEDAQDPDDEAEIDGAADASASDEEDGSDKDNSSASDAPPDQMKGPKPNPLRRWAADLAEKLKNK